jgi:hypothetical protein
VDRHEEWRPVFGFESEYLISNFGRVWSNHSRKVLKNKCVHGYEYVSLCSQGFRQERRIHRLVAEAFIPNPDEKPTVNHINEDKSDNRVQNLEWATTKEQNAHGTRTIRAMANTDWAARTAKTDYSEIARKHDYYGMNRNQMRPIFQLTKDGIFIARHDGVSAAARAVNGHAGGICSVLKGRRKTSGGFKWKYEQTVNIDVAI